MRLEQIGRWRPRHACLPDSHDEVFAAYCGPGPCVEDTCFFTPLLALLFWCEVPGKPVPLPRRPHFSQLVWIFDALPVVSFCKASPFEDELPRLFDLIWRFQDPGVVTILSGRRAL